MNKPNVDYIKGISPAIAIEQIVNSTNPRSTVGTSTEIYDYLKLLFARIGKTYSPVSGNEVKKETVTDVINYIKSLEVNTKVLLLAPVHIPEERNLLQTLKILAQQGYSRIKYKGEIIRIEDVDTEIEHDFHLVIDRIVVQDDEDFYNRLADAVQTAFFEGKGECIIDDVKAEKQTTFNNKIELDGIQFLEPNTHLFSFNNPYGACPACDGFGNVIGIDDDLVIPNTSLSIYENAILPWKTDSFSLYKNDLIDNAYKFDIPIHKPWFQLSEEQKLLVWKGNKSFQGINDFFKYLEEKSYKIQYRVMLSRYRGKTKCAA